MMIEFLLNQLKEAQAEELRLIKAEIEARNDYEQRMLARSEVTLHCLRLKDRIDYEKRSG